VEFVVFSDLLNKSLLNEGNYLNRLHSVIAQQTSLKALCVSLSYPKYLFALCITWTDIHGSLTVFCKI